MNYVKRPTSYLKRYTAKCGRVFRESTGGTMYSTSAAMCVDGGMSEVSAEKPKPASIVACPAMTE